MSAGPRRAAALAGALLVSMARPDQVHAQQRALPLPLTTGAAIVQTLSFAWGDRESVHRVVLASGEGLHYEWSYLEVHASGDTLLGSFKYLEAAADLADARRLRGFQDKDQPEAHPGYTMHAISRAAYRRLRSGQSDSAQVMTVDQPAGGGQLAVLGLGSGRSVPVRWRGTLSPMSSGTVPFPLLVNGRRVEVPALRLRGEFTARQGRWTPEFWVLADSTYPLLLKWVGAFREPGNVLQTVRVDVPPGLTGGAGDLGLMLEGELESECRVELPGIYFAFNSAELDPASGRTIATIAGILARQPGWIVTLEGHTDSIGSPAANLTLSQRRVEAVRARLIEEHQAVGPARLRTVGHGSVRPREPNGTVEGRARNRRVELVRECAEPAGESS